MRADIYAELRRIRSGGKDDRDAAVTVV